MEDSIKKQKKIGETALHVGRPNLPEKKRVLDLVSRVMDNQWLSNMGPCTLELEEKLANFLGVKHCLCVCNATIGLILVQKALELEGEVIIPSFTFIATAHSLSWQGIKPVFCDINKSDHLIDTNKIESLITPSTSAILAVNLWGQPCDINILKEISKRHNLKLIFDSAQAFGSKYNKTYLGGFGDAEIFSFHATKVFSTGEGGAITTNSDKLASKIRKMRNFGFSYENKIKHVGINAKMSEITAAFGLAGFGDINTFIKRNKKVYKWYVKAFNDVKGIRFLNYKHPVNYQYVVAQVSSRIRDELLKNYHKENILVRKYFHPGAHNAGPYNSVDNETSNTLTVTDKISNEVLVFPTGQQMSYDKIKRIREIYISYNQHNN